MVFKRLKKKRYGETYYGDFDSAFLQLNRFHPSYKKKT